MKPNSLPWLLIVYLLTTSVLTIFSDVSTTFASQKLLAANYRVVQTQKPKDRGIPKRLEDGGTRLIPDQSLMANS